MKNRKKINKKWSKQCGYFSFRHPVFDKQSHITINVYYKDELIGTLPYSVPTYNQKESYTLPIYDKNNSKFLNTIVGIAQCVGATHKLPKVILSVTLSHGYSVLVSNKKVMVEKYDDKHMEAPINILKDILR